MAIETLLLVVIWVVVVGVIFYLLWWVIDHSGIPAPFSVVAKALVAVVAVYLLIHALFGVLPALPRW